MESTKERMISFCHTCLHISKDATLGLWSRLIFSCKLFSEKSSISAVSVCQSVPSESMIWNGNCVLLVSHQNSHWMAKLMMVCCYLQNRSEVVILSLKYYFIHHFVSISILKIILWIIVIFTPKVEKLLRWYIVKQFTKPISFL